jgi:hypothetical protein
VVGSRCQMNKRKLPPTLILFQMLLLDTMREVRWYAKIPSCHNFEDGLSKFLSLVPPHYLLKSHKLRHHKSHFLEFLERRDGRIYIELLRAQGSFIFFIGRLT